MPKCSVCEKMRKYANDLLSCSHSLCSMKESIYEEIYGKKILEILDSEENKKDNKNA